MAASPIVLLAIYSHSFGYQGNIGTYDWLTWTGGEPEHPPIFGPYPIEAGAESFRRGFYYSGENLFHYSPTVVGQKWRPDLNYPYILRQWFWEIRNDEGDLVCDFETPNDWVVNLEVVAVPGSTINTQDLEGGQYQSVFESAIDAHSFYLTTRATVTPPDNWAPHHFSIRCAPEWNTQHYGFYFSGSTLVGFLNYVQDTYLANTHYVLDFTATPVDPEYEFVAQDESAFSGHTFAASGSDRLSIYGVTDATRNYVLNRDVVQWDWDFGDGASATESDPATSHEYEEAFPPPTGVTVTMVPTDQFALTGDEASKVIFPEAPGAQFGVVCDPHGVIFTVVKVGADSRVFRFNTNNASRQGLATIAGHKSPTLRLDEKLRLIVAAQDEAGVTKQFVSTDMGRSVT